MHVSLIPSLSLSVCVSSFHYGGEAILRDPEQSEVISQLLKGLQVVQLEYDYTSGRLDSWDVSVLQLAGIWSRPVVGAEVPPPSSSRSSSSSSRGRKTAPVGLSRSPGECVRVIDGSV